MNNTIKERLSLAYITAVCARAGFEVCEVKVDIDSVDGVIISKKGKHPLIKFQAKCTSRDLVGNSKARFDLPIKNYNDLRSPHTVPFILVVVYLPQDDLQWLSQSHDNLVLQRCGYWLSLHGAPSSANENTVAVTIPKTQVFDVSGIQDLMIRAEAIPVI